MSGSSLNVAFPSGPVTDADGNVTPVWRGYFQQVYVRTGAAPGASSPQLAASLVAETSARTSADAGLTNAIAAERTAREHADSAEATTRAAADASLMPKAGGTFTGAVYGPSARFDLFQSGTMGGPTWTSGYGAPASTQPLGSIYSRRDGTVGATLYVSRGAGTWLPVAAV